MINLLPDETKKQLKAAHSNVVISRYLLFASIGTGFLILACAVSFIFIENSHPSLSSDNGKSNEILVSSAQNQLNTLNLNISTAKNILDQQINYSDVISGIAAALPAGMILDSLSISNNSSGAPVTLLISARSADNIEQLKSNFSTSRNPLFLSFSVAPNTESTNYSSGYTTRITCTLTINKGVVQ